MKKRYRSEWSKKRNYNSNRYILKNCNSLPSPIEPEDIKKIIKRIRGKPRDKALVLVLLRTGMRICELLSTKMQNINLRERKILIFESAKNRIGRVVYFFEDSRNSMKKMNKKKKKKKKYKLKIIACFFVIYFLLFFMPTG